MVWPLLTQPSESRVIQECLQVAGLQTEPEASGIEGLIQAVSGELHSHISVCLLQVGVD